jgi:3'(2'), 5'-bisphosphate nucleotidase
MTTAEINKIIGLLNKAAEQILEVYNNEEFAAEIEWKEDLSPLTVADKRSHEYLASQLILDFPGIPLMSEEAVQLPFEERRRWQRYWCLDPLDGTKEFIKRNDQFTINLALIENGRPVLGFIHVPVMGCTYWAAHGLGAYVFQDGDSCRISANRKETDWIAVGSGSHGADEERVYLSQFPIAETIKVGSALKFCMIASGQADVYFRSGPTMEWDTAAGHILVEEAGARLEYLSENLQHYNKQHLVNPSFIVKIV